MDSLGDGKAQAREAALDLLQIIMKQSVESPRAVLDRVMNRCLAHKRIQMKEGGLLCLITTMKKYEFTIFVCILYLYGLENENFILHYVNMIPI